MKRLKYVFGEKYKTTLNYNGYKFNEANDYICFVPDDIGDILLKDGDKFIELDFPTEFDIKDYPCDIVLLKEKRKATVDVIIPFYELPFLTLTALEEARINTKTKCHYYLVGYLGDEGSKQILTKALDKDTSLIFTKRNYGFVGHANIGLYLSTSPYIFLLNNDARVKAGCIDILVDVLRKHKDIGIVAASSELYQAEEEIDYQDNFVPFCAVMMRREVFKNVGYLDINFGLGLCDDNDYSLRAVEKGYKIAISKKAQVIHTERTTFTYLEEQERFNWRGYLQKNTEYLKAKWRDKWLKST